MAIIEKACTCNHCAGKCNWNGKGFALSLKKDRGVKGRRLRRRAR